MAIYSSYQIFHESMEKAKFNQTNPPPPEAIEIIGEHEVHLSPDVDEGPVQMGMETDLDELTAIETCQAPVTSRDVAMMEGIPLPEVEEHPDGHKDPERLKAAQRDLDRLQTMGRAARAHETFSVVDSLHLEMEDRNRIK
jgi:hypothetical protein